MPRLLSSSFFAHFIFCLLLCLLSYCAKPSPSSLGGGILETQALVRVPCFAGVAVLYCASSRPRDGPWHHSRHGNGLLWGGHTECGRYNYRRADKHCASNANERSGTLRDVRAK